MECALLRGASKVNNREKKKCEYYKNVDMVKCKDFGIVDIEELCSIGNSYKFCPYYYETSIIQRANIVFLPYNYLICQDIRKAMGIDLQNAIVIFDEGHNIQKVCEDEESCYIDENIINSITNELFKNVSHQYEKILNYLKIKGKSSVVFRIYYYLFLKHHIGCITCMIGMEKFICSYKHK